MKKAVNIPKATFYVVGLFVNLERDTVGHRAWFERALSTVMHLEI